MKEFWKNFFTDTDSTGRHVVKSFRTGKVYAVEPIGTTRTNFGDVNPATKEVEGNYGDKYKGSIDKKESLITEENGFKNIQTLEAGVSPYSIIEKLDSAY